MLEQLITARQYAEENSYSRNTVTSWITRGQLPTIVIAGRIFINRKARPTHHTDTGKVRR